MACLLTIRNELLQICERKNLLCVQCYKTQKDVYFSLPNPLTLKKKLIKKNLKDNLDFI